MRWALNQDETGFNRRDRFPLIAIGGCWGEKKGRFHARKDAITAKHYKGIFGIIYVGIEYMYT